MSSRTLRASEIGEYLYCGRAWGYRRAGYESQNIEQLKAGTSLHQEHGREVMAAGCLRTVGYVLLLAGVAAGAAYLTAQYLV